MSSSPSNSDKQWYVKQEANQNALGPYTSNELLNLAATGRVNASTQVMSEKATKNQWVAATRLPKLAAAISAAPPQPVMQQQPVIQHVTVTPAKKGTSVLLILSIICGVLFLGCCGVFSIFVGSLPKVPEKTPEQIAADKEDAKYRSDARRLVRDIESLISKKLKAPTTAKFDLGCNIKRFGNVVVAIVEGDVTSENSFGANLTKPVKAMYVVQNDQYTLTNYMFEDSSLILNQDLLDRAMAEMQKASKK